MNVIDNLLPNDYLRELQEMFMAEDFPWFYTKGIGNSNDNDFFFSHLFFNEDKQITSSAFEKIKPIIYFIEHELKNVPTDPMRIKANCYPKQPTNVKHGTHIDSPRPHTVALFSVNTCNGYTVVDGEQYQSVENRVIVFDGRIPHYSVNQTDTDLRININFNLV